MSPQREVIPVRSCEDPAMGTLPWGPCRGDTAAAEKWVWLRERRYGLSEELTVLLPLQPVGLGVIPVAPLLQQQLPSTSTAKCHRVPTDPCGQGTAAGKTLGQSDLQPEAQRLRHIVWLLPCSCIRNRVSGVEGWLSAPRCAPGSAFPGALSCVCAPWQHDQRAPRMEENPILPSDPPRQPPLRRTHCHLPAPTTSRGPVHKKNVPG